MSAASSASAGIHAPRQADEPSWLRSNWGLLLAVAALIVVILLPAPEGLSIAGQRMLAVLAVSI